MESRESRRLFPGGEPLVGWDLCLMNYPSRRGIRLNLKRVGGREGSSGKLIQTTHCPPSRLSFSSSSFFLPPPSILSTTLRLLLVPPRKAKTRSLATDATRGGRGVPSYFASPSVYRRSKCREARELISNVLLFRQTSNPTRPDKCTLL